MSGPVFVIDAEEKPLMPMSAAYARKLLRSGKATIRPHHAFTVVQLAQVVPQPVLRPVLVGVAIHYATAELFLIAEGEREAFPLLAIVVDLQNDLPRRIRRRAGHRRRRRSRGRYRSVVGYGQPFKARRPSVMKAGYKSRKGRAYHHRKNSRPHQIEVSPTIRWRVQCIERVLAVLQKFVPISQVVILDPPMMMMLKHISLSSAMLRQRLIDVYGRVNKQGKRVAQCAYCGTTVGSIEVDHVLPKSRGGTRAWENLVLACASCNEHKGDRTPAEAGMHLRVQPVPYRSRAYELWTARVLAKKLVQPHLRVVWNRSRDETLQSLAPNIRDVLNDPRLDSKVWSMVVVAKPLSHGRKQKFTGRNYPHDTPLRPPYVRIKNTIKRRVRVNRGLALWQDGKATRAQAVGYDEPIPPDTQQFITIGMLCEGRRAGNTMSGIVGAIHSSTRLTLLVPATVMPEKITWKRVIISPRLHVRIVSSDRVLFLPLHSAISGPSNDTQ